MNPVREARLRSSSCGVAAFALRGAPGQGLQSLDGKSAAGSRFQVSFEGKSTVSIPQGDGILDLPGFEFRGVRNFTGVVFAQAVLKVLRRTGVMASRRGQGLQDIDGVERAHP